MGTAIKIPYNTIAEFNVDSKAERGQLNLAHVKSSTRYSNKVGLSCVRPS